MRCPSSLHLSLRRSVPLAALAVILAGGPAQAAPFERGRTLGGVPVGGLGPVPSGMVTADFDGDGRHDVAVADMLRPGATILPTGGDGGFRRAERTSGPFLSTTLAPVEIDAAAPGRELVVGGASPPELRLVVRSAAGTWSTVQRMRGANGGPADIAAGDLTGDGIDDLASFSMSGVAEVHLWRDGAYMRTLRTATPPLPGRLGSLVTIADVDGDGDGDVVVGSWLRGDRRSEYRTLLNDGRGGLTPGPFRRFTGLVESLEAVDITCDGEPELVGAAVDGAIVALSMGPGRALTEVVRRPAEIGANSIDIADVDRDGRPDAVIGNALGYARITLDICRHGFAPQQSIQTVFSTETVRLLDLNGDGYPELLAGGWFARGLTIARNLGAAAVR